MKNKIIITVLILASLALVIFLIKKFIVDKELDSENNNESKKKIKIVKNDVQQLPELVDTELNPPPPPHLLTPPDAPLGYTLTMPVGEGHWQYTLLNPTLGDNRPRILILP